MSHLAPRIGFTCWHTILCRWTTASRTGRKGQSCHLGCTEYEDSVEHYAKCRIAREWAATRMQLHYDHRNSLHMWTLTAHFPTKTELFKTAFMIYATYRATNTFDTTEPTRTPTSKEKKPKNTSTRLSTRPTSASTGTNYSRSTKPLVRTRSRKARRRTPKAAR